MAVLFRVLSVFLFVMTVFIFSKPALAEEDRLDRIERELGEIRKENNELKLRLQEVETDDEEVRHDLQKLSSLVEVSGYADAEFYFTDQENENNKFRIRHLSLFFSKDIQKEWKLFSEIEYEDAPLIESRHTTDTPDKVQGKLFVEQMYIEYHPQVKWDMRFGRFLTPAGIWNIYHYPPFVPTQERPLIVRKIFPQVSDGIQLRNSFTLKESILDTHLYIANGSGNPGRLDRNENKGIGARVNADIIYGLSAGASYYREKDNQNINADSYGVHLLFNHAPFKFQTEYQFRHNAPESARSFNDKGLYAQLTYDIAKWTFAGRWDWYDSNDTDSKNDLFRYTGAVNYHFAHNVVGKAEYNRNEFDDPAVKDYNEVILAIVVAIGDL